MGEDNMTLNDYQIDAMGVRLETATPDYCLKGLVGEVGELFSLEAKAIRDGKRMDHDLMVKKELGDALWFIAAIAQDYGYTLDDIARSNLYKLYKRKQDNTLQGSGDYR